MLDPATLGVIVLEGLSWIVGGTTGSASDRAFCAAAHGLRRRLGGLIGTQEGSELAKAIRIAQMQSLEQTVRDYEALDISEWPDAPQLRPELFIADSKEFCKRTVGRSRELTVKLNLEITDDLASALDTVLMPIREGPPTARASAVRARVEGVVLAELKTTLAPVTVPSGFVAQFRHGSPDRLSWFERFVRAVMRELEVNQRLRGVVLAQGIAKLQESSHEMMQRMDEMSRAVSELLVQVGPRVAWAAALQGVIDEIREEAAGTGIIARARVLRYLIRQPVVSRRLEEFGVRSDAIAAQLDELSEAIAPLEGVEDAQPSRSVAKIFLRAHELFEVIGPTAPALGVFMGLAEETLTLMDSGRRSASLSDGRWTTFVVECPGLEAALRNETPYEA